MGKIIRNNIVYGGTSNIAGNISYNNTSSGLNSTTVQNAITEVNAKVKNGLQQLETLPAASITEEGKIYQYIGDTTQDYTHGYIYECVSDGDTPATYSWTIVSTFEVDGVGKFEYDANDEVLGEYFNQYEDIVDGSTTISRNSALGLYSHVEGMGNSISTNCTAAHIEGQKNIINTGTSAGHVEGNENTLNSGSSYGHIEGSTNTVGTGSAQTHIEGYNNTAYSGIVNSHIEGANNATGAALASGSGTNQLHIEGYGNTAYSGSHNSHIEGSGNTMTDVSQITHIEGSTNIVSKLNSSHVEGRNNTVQAAGTATTDNHIEGYYNNVKGMTRSHVEGTNNIYSSDSCAANHIEGWNNNIGSNTSGGAVSSFDSNHIEGYQNTIKNNIYKSHIEGTTNTVQNQEIVHVEGQGNNINNDSGSAYSNHIEGQGNTVKNLNYSHVEGQGNNVQGVASSHIEGYNTVYGYNALYSHIEGQNTIGSQASPVTLTKSHIEGDGNQVSAGVASATSLHIEGMSNIVENRGTGETTNIIATHVEGQSNRVDASNTHVEGTSNIVYHSVSTSHVEGTQNHIKGNYSHTEGTYNMNEAAQTHIEGQNNTVSVSGSTSHVEGSYNTVNSSIVHMEGNSNTIGTNSPYSYVGGQENDVGNGATRTFTHGYYNLNNTDNSFVIGRYNEPDNTFNETSNSIRTDDIEDDIILITSDGTTSSSAGVGTTDFIPIQQSIEFKIYAHTMSNDKIYICYYDKNKNFLASDELEGESGVVNTTRKLNGDDTYKSGTNYSNYYQDAKYMRISADFSSTDLNDATLYFSKPRTLFVIGNGYHDYSQNPAVDVRSNIVEVYNDNVKIYGDTKLKGTIEQEVTCKATGNYSNALGTGTIAETNNSTVIGQYNIPDSTMSAQNIFDGTINEGAYSTTTDPTDATFDDYAVEMPYPERNIQTTSKLAIDNNTSLTVTAPAGSPVTIPGVTPAGDYCVIVCFFNYAGTLIKKEVYYETNEGDLVTHTFTSSYLKTAGAYKVAVCCQLNSQYVDSLSITQTVENLFVIGNGIDSNNRSNIITVSPSETIINNDITLTGNIVITGTIATKTIKSSNSYYGGHIRQDGECPFRYRRMLYFGNYTGDETPKIIVDNTDPQNPVPYQPGYYSLELESYAGLPRAVMKMIENSIYSPDGEFKANMRHIVSYYCALLQNNVKSRIEITSITASNTTFTQDGETYHCPLVNYVILPPWDGSSGTYTGAAILDIVFNNFQA